MDTPSLANERRAIVTKRKRQNSENDENCEPTVDSNEKVARTWREALGPPPPKVIDNNFIVIINYEKYKFLGKSSRMDYISKEKVGLAS